MRTEGWALVMLLGCGGDPSEEPAPTPAPSSSKCTKRSGLYKGTYTATSGNCGPINEAIFNADTPIPEGCTGKALPLDVCDGTIDVLCSLPGSADKILQRGTLHWKQDASAGAGEVYIELQDASGRVRCSGIYDVAIVRQR